MRLNGKVAIVTGSSKGIGKAIALAYAREGANVVVNYARSEIEAREAVDTIVKMGGKAFSVKADVSDADQVKRMVETTLNRFGKIDILVNNAGVLARKKLTDTTEEEWDTVINVNLKGVFLCSKYVIPEMIKRGGGVIINIASAIGIIGHPNRAAYCASKGGVVLLTKQMAIDYGRYNIRVNSICPGAIETAMNLERIARAKNPEQELKKTEQLHVLGRMGKPEEIADAAVFLASDESTFVTGSCLCVDGGWSTGNFAGLLEELS